MTPPAQSVIILATVGTVTIASLSALTAGQMPKPRILVGGLVMGVTLTAAAQWAPTLASAMAGVILITALLGVGGNAYAGISRTLGGTK